MARENTRPARDKKQEDDGLVKKLIQVNRVTKTVKGGRNMRFAALVIVGDGNGKVGLGMGKSKEVPEAIDKATAQAKRNMFAVAVNGTSIPHQVLGVFGRGSVLMMPAAEGTGVIAGGAVRDVLMMAGVKDIRTKALRSRNPKNLAKATLRGLLSLRDAQEIAETRGKSVDEVIG